ncbi:hypothetical protein TrRE_jg729, partial [Triparma retinervis]
MAEGHEHPFTFSELYSVLLLMVAFWVAGKGAARLTLPSLVGEIAVGMLAGPNCFDIAPKPKALMMFGEVGLLLLFLEAGLDVDMEMLKLVGNRGIMLSLFGSMLALVLGTLLSHFALGNGWVESFGAGCTLAPTSMGIALNVLRSCKVLNTPSGQLIIAAAMLQDVIGIILLAELKATKDFSFLEFIIPIVSAVGMCAFFGWLAIAVVPQAMQKHILKKFHHHIDRQNIVLATILVASLALMPASHYARGSYLLGCFLAGLCFCTDHHTHPVWQAQVKRLLQWLMRLFFACTIGFEVPIKNLGNGKVWGHAALYVFIIATKLLSGIFAIPLSKREFLKIGFSMVSSCELAFIISVNAWIEGLISDDTFDALILAALISILISPVCLRKVLLLERQEKEKEIEEAKMETHLDDGERLSFDGSVHKPNEMHHIYFQLQTKSHGQFGFQDKMLRAVFQLEMSIIDFRSFHPHGNFNVHVVNEMYLKDNTKMIYDTPDKEERDSKVLAQRMEDLYKAAKAACGEESASIKVYRWLPGSKGADEGEHTVPGVQPPSLNRSKSLGAMSNSGRRDRAASGGSIGGGNGDRLSVIKGDLPHPANIQNERRPALDHSQLLMQLDQLAYIQAEKEFQKKQRHHVSLSAAMGSHTHPGELVYHQRHHELDGYVHSDPHDAFDPDEIEGEHFDSDSESSDGEGSVGGGGGGGWRNTYSAPGSKFNSQPGSGYASPKVQFENDGEGGVDIEMLEVGGVHHPDFEDPEDLVEEIRHRVEHAHSVSAQQGMVVDLEAVRERLSTMHLDIDKVVDKLEGEGGGVGTAATSGTATVSGGGTTEGSEEASAAGTTTPTSGSVSRNVSGAVTPVEVSAAESAAAMILSGGGEKGKVEPRTPRNTMEIKRGTRAPR